MNKKKTLGLIASILLFLSFFLPWIRLGFMGDLSGMQIIDGFEHIIENEDMFWLAGGVLLPVGAAIGGIMVIASKNGKAGALFLALSLVGFAIMFGVVVKGLVETEFEAIEHVGMGAYIGLVGLVLLIMHWKAPLQNV